MFSVALPNSRSCDLSKFHFCSLLAAFVLVARAKMTTRCQCLFDETGTLLAFTCHAFLLPKCIGREPNSSKSQYLKKFLIVATKSPVSATRDRLQASRLDHSWLLLSANSAFRKVLALTCK